MKTSYSDKGITEKSIRELGEQFDLSPSAVCISINRAFEKVATSVIKELQLLPADPKQLSKDHSFQQLVVEVLSTMPPNQDACKWRKKYERRNCK